ncbi:MAG: hypothetical protein UZ09_BCD002000221 [Bacteroidetes bacterium OLB9]|nr:MAG: hypothetical protein UZ09_BCD002000221 [Bacteroidetes bacterium OLB9]
MSIKNYLKNIPGKGINRKVIAFAVDDYGNIRQNDWTSLQYMERHGFEIQNHFDRLDGLSTSDDLNALFDVLSKHRDHNAIPPVFTVFTNPQNLNFEKIVSDGYSSVEYEDFTESMNKYSQVDTADIFMNGIEAKYLYPEYHGRTHFHEGMFVSNLLKKDTQTFWCLDHQCYTGLTNHSNNHQSYLSTYSYNDKKEFESLKIHLNEGILAFERIFGRRPLHFTSPGQLTHEELHRYLFEQGVLYIDTTPIKRQFEGNNKYSLVISWLGKKNKNGPTAIVRNCIFEPMYGIDVGHTLNQIKIAFALNKPAIISTHRVNFCGRIDENNRKQGLKKLDVLISSILKKWPDVEFMPTTQMAALI